MNALDQVQNNAAEMIRTGKSLTAQKDSSNVHSL
jgi:hypothetical protein